MQRNRSSRKQHSNQGTHRQQRRQYPCPLPTPLPLQEIVEMSDDDLVLRVRAMEDQRQQVVDVKLSPLEWEIESMYARRELEVRRWRRDLHDRYLRSLEREQRQEAQQQEEGAL